MCSAPFIYYFFRCQSYASVCKCVCMCLYLSLSLSVCVCVCRRLSIYILIYTKCVRNICNYLHKYIYKSSTDKFNKYFFTFARTLTMKIITSTNTRLIKIFYYIHYMKSSFSKIFSVRLMYNGSTLPYNESKQRSSITVARLYRGKRKKDNSERKETN